MLIEESKISRSPSRVPEFTTPILEETELRRDRPHRKVSYSPPAVQALKTRPLSIRTPRRLDPLEATMRTIVFSRAEDLSDSSGRTAPKKKKGRKTRLAEI